MDPYVFGRSMLDFPPAAELIGRWERLAAEPFCGLTTDGHVRSGLFGLADEGAPVEAMTTAANALLARLTDIDRGRLCFPIDAPQWRRWSNPEFLINPNGLRLEELSPALREAILAVLRASLSPVGFHKARGCMQTNAFLGELCDVPTIMNEWSYNFLLFGLPDARKPWGWSLYGHHLALNCLVVGRQMVVSPSFMGAEPNLIDAGPHAGLTLFSDEEDMGLALMRSLPPDLAARAVIYEQMRDAAMPPGRWHPADQRHLGGAFQDNRIVPCEGVAAKAFDADQRALLLKLIATYLSYLPEAPLAARLRQVEAHLDETWWSWIGGTGDQDPFYYRIQSPVVMIEFDHHSGVWLSNAEPAKYHVHTLVRTPNGNDYGQDLLRQYFAQGDIGASSALYATRVEA